MPFMPSMPTDALVKDVYSINPQTFRPWLHVEEAIMRGPSAFTAGERCGGEVMQNSNRNPYRCNPPAFC